MFNLDCILFKIILAKTLWILRLREVDVSLILTSIEYDQLNLFSITNKFNGIDFKVANVATLPKPEFTEKMHYRLQTPWVVSHRTENDK